MPKHASIAYLILCTLNLACGSKQDMGDVAKDLALKEELSQRDEAMVWLYDPEGNLSTHWIRSDVAGIEVVASRDELLIPTPGALWRIVVDHSKDDHDFIELEDLVSGETSRIRLDESAIEPVDEDDQVEILDAGAKANGDTETETAEPESNAEQTKADEAADSAAGAPPPPEEPPSESETECRDNAVQEVPNPLATIGPYVFLRFEERLYNCEDALLLTQDRFLVFDTSAGEEIEVLSDKELSALLESPDLADLERSGEVSLDGVIPFFNPGFELGLTYVFSARSTFLSPDNEPQSVTSSLEMSAQNIPEMLASFIDAPDVARTFSLMVPSALPGGWWPLMGSPEEIEAQLIAFLPPPQLMAEDE